MRWAHGVSVVLVLAAWSIAAAGQEVVMPLQDFEALRKRANPPPTPTPTPPPLAAPYAFEAAAIELAVGTESARVTQHLTISLFDTDWLTISLPALGALVASDLGGLEGRITADGEWRLQVRGTGRRTVRLESVIPVQADDTATRPTWNTELRLPQAAACTGVVRGGEGVDEVIFGPAGLATGRDDRGGFRFAGKPGSVLAIGLFGKAATPERSKLDLRFAASAATLTTIARTRTRLRAWTDVQVAQGQLDELSLEVPGGFSVVAVRGVPAVGWDVDGEVVTVTPLAPVEGRLALTLTLTGPPLDRFASPLVVARGAARQTLVSAVEVEGDGLIELESQTGLRQPDERESSQLPREFVADARFPVVVQDPTKAPRWVVTWAEKAEALAVQVDRLLVDVLIGDSGQAAYQCWLEVRNAGADTLGVAMPQGFVVTDAGRDGRQITPGERAGELVMPLAASSGIQVLHVAGLLPLPPLQDKVTLQLPMPTLSAPVGRVAFRLVLPPGRSYEVDRAGTTAFAVPQPPPAAKQKGTGDPLVQQVEMAASATDRYEPRVFTVPPGYGTVTGSWNALSTHLSAIQVESDTESQKWSWF